MAEEKSRAALAVMLLLAVSLSGGDFSAGSDCSQSTTEVNARMSLVSSVVDTQRAEQSQRRHLEALFNRYGENGTISLDGLKRLLQSVGLDRVRTVMVQHHEQIGYRHHHHHYHHHHHHHDHQEGHNHHHHPDDNHSHHQKHVHAEPSRPGKFPKNVGNQDGTLRKKIENTESHHNLYDKKSTVAAAAQEVGTTAVYSAQLVLKQVIGLEQASPPTSGGAAAAARPGAGNHTQATAVSRGDDGDHDPEYDQDHVHINRSLESVECLNVSSILSSHGMSQEVGVTLRDFRYLCPALLNQIDYGACIVHGDDTKHGERDHKHHKHAHGHHGDHNNSDHDHSTGREGSKNITTAWVGGLVSITVISLLSLLGVVLIPLINRVFFKFLLSFLVALAVGTLSGDAFLHLIPHSQGGHHHHHHEDSGMNMEGPHLHDENLDAVWKGLTALGGVYFMFLIEHFLTQG